MNHLATALMAGALLAFALVSGRLRGSMITAPLVFVGFGLIVGQGGFDLAQVDLDHGVIHLVAELTLILVLFTDAAAIDLKQVKNDHTLPVRMLVVGLPFTIVIGALFAIIIFPHFGLAEAALLAALLAPTDAALGQAVVSANAVPIRIRQAINVESGLNDGIALPVVLLLAAVAAQAGDATSANEWIRFGLLQITLGPLVGLIVGYVGGRAIDVAAQSGWANEAYQGIAILSLAVLAYLLAERVGGNGFIAAFVAGAVFGNTIRHSCTFLFEFMETEGQLLMALTFFVFGAALLPEGLALLSWSVFGYALLSLTVIRMVPIALALTGAGISWPTKLFLGWFGPRGLASILFVLLILEQSDVAHSDELLAITVITVALSALLHGLSAAPLAKIYGGLAARMGECEENRPIVAIPVRSNEANPNG